ncbi:MAG: hypothetical protein H7339_14135 [Arcicella sp.]|nr:hypothetical protein [Arcicella sp.]
MKNLLPYLIFLMPMLTFSQTGDEKEIKTILIDLNNPTVSYEVIVDKGTYTLKIKLSDKKMKEFKIKSETIEYSPLDLKTEKKFNENSIETISQLNFDSNTIYTISMKLEDDTERKYIYKSVSKRSWTTTFGANAIFLTNPNSYKTIKSGTDKYTVTEYSSEKRIEYIPSLMFTFMDKSKDLAFGFTGGLGFDLEQISVFSGISLGIGQNIILTGGMAFHKQDKLNSTYTVGQEVDTILTTENLTTKQYRFNPFVGISFRLDSNPLK